MADSLTTQSFNSIGSGTSLRYPTTMPSFNVAQPLVFDTPSSNKSALNPLNYMTSGNLSGSILGGISNGVAVDPQSSSIGAAAFDVLGGAAGGAAAGIAGGPIGMLIGGGVGGLIGLGKAFFGVSQNRKAERERKRMIAAAEAAEQKRVENEEKWKTINRFDSLKEAQTNRSDSLIRQGWMDYQNKLTIMNNFLNSNTQARDDLMRMLQPVGGK